MNLTKEEKGMIAEFALLLIIFILFIVGLTYRWGHMKYKVKVPIEGFNIYHVLADNEEQAREMVLNGEILDEEMKAQEIDEQTDSGFFQVEELKGG